MRVKPDEEVKLRILTGKETPRIKSPRRTSLELKKLGLKPFKDEDKIIVP